MAKKSRNNNRKFLSRFLKDNSDNHNYYNDSNKKNGNFQKYKVQIIIIILNEVRQFVKYLE